MGYTRYWERTKKPITQEFVDAVNDIIKECKTKGIVIRDGLGNGEPKVSLNVISINGDGERDLDHETCYFDNEETEFAFCKTARKPYDYAVRNILKVAEEMGIVTDVSCDGENEEIISDEDYLKPFVHMLTLKEKYAQFRKNE